MGRRVGAICLLLSAVPALAADPATQPAAAPMPTAAVPAETPAASDPPFVPASTMSPQPSGYAGPASMFGAPMSAESLQHNDFVPLTDRFRIGLPDDDRTLRRDARGFLTNPYNQNVLKGDYPILDDDKFLILTLTSDSIFEARKLPVPSGVSSRASSRFTFFGQGDSQSYIQNFILGIDFFKGDTVFKPRDWDLHADLVYNVNYVHTDELQLVDVDVSQGRDRFDDHFAVQELFAELHLVDVSPNYDFTSVRVGIQPFNADFRGFLFSDEEPGVRLFGNYDNNRTQYNLAGFAQLEKDTNTGLNTLDLRDQFVFIANVYRQDFIFEGYTAQLSASANIDNGDKEYDDNGFLVRPSPIGTVGTRNTQAYYLGWAGDGHIGRFNLTHQFYQVFGTESLNPIAGRGTTIDARFFALELSYDENYMRYRTSFMYASGDSNPKDGRATGFDSIFDNPNFAGGGTSFFTRQAIKLTGSGVNLTNRNSIIPDLRTSKEQGQANFVNPGLLLFNIGFDYDVTPKLTLSSNINYLRFDNPAVIKQVLHDEDIKAEVGIDASVGLRYRPLLDNNVIINAGAAAFLPGEGFKQIYTSDTLYSTFMSLTVTF